MFVSLLKILLLCHLSHGVSVPSIPTVRFSGKHVHGVPNRDHILHGQAIEILHSEDCGVGQVSTSSIEIGDRCHFLRGVYRYIYSLPEQNERHQILLGFSLAKKNGQSHIFLVNSPIELEESWD